MLKKLLFSAVSLLVLVNFSYAAGKEYTGKILEIQDGGSYSYIKIQTKEKTFWVATMKASLEIGKILTVKEQVWMKNFKSTALNKTFDEILFADLTGANKNIKNVHGVHGQSLKKKPNPSFNKDIVISKGKAVKVTIKELYENKAKYKNKNVEIEGEVIKISNKVMGNTWIKLKNADSSVIFRSPNEDESIKIGDKVKAVGTLNTDIDFGYGYKYEVLGVNTTFTKL